MKNAIRRIKKYALHPGDLFKTGVAVLIDSNIGHLLTDKMYIKIMWWSKFGRKEKLNLDSPEGFNQKIQWLKLNDHKEIYSTMVDKYEVKDYVAKQIGKEHIIPTYGVYDSFDQIDFDALPNQFVMKCTHDSGGLVICRNKEELDIAAAKKKINRSLKYKYYYHGREWPYKSVRPRIIIEKYMVDETVSELRDFKFFCFNGVCRCMKVDFDRFVNHHANYYDPQGNLLDFGEKICPPDKEKNIVLPKNKDRMIEIAEKLSSIAPFLRVDFYDVNGEIYFGELTFFPASGFGAFTDSESNYKLGKWLELPKSIGGGYIAFLDDCIIKLQCKKKVENLTDYKFYCFDGEPKFLYISTGLEDHATASISFVNLDWSFAPFRRNDYKPFDKLPPKPAHFDEMINICRKLSYGIPFLRCDLYEINGTIYFSELTFSPCGGMMPFEPKESNVEIGKLLRLPEGG